MTMLPVMSTDLSKDDLEGRKDHQDEVRLSAMYSAMSKMPSEKMKMDMIVVVVGVVMSLSQMAQSLALLPCEIANAHWAFLWDVFVF